MLPAAACGRAVPGGATSWQAGAAVPPHARRVTTEPGAGRADAIAWDVSHAGSKADARREMLRSARGAQRSGRAGALPASLPSMAPRAATSQRARDGRRSWARIRPTRVPTSRASIAGSRCCARATPRARVADTRLARARAVPRALRSSSRGVGTHDGPGQDATRRSRELTLAQNGRLGRARSDRRGERRVASASRTTPTPVHRGARPPAAGRGRRRELRVAVVARQRARNASFRAPRRGARSGAARTDRPPPGRRRLLYVLTRARGRRQGTGPPPPAMAAGWWRTTRSPTAQGRAPSGSRSRSRAGLGVADRSRGRKK